jgi:hypothetical protein
MSFPRALDSATVAPPENGVGGDASACSDSLCIRGEVKRVAIITLRLQPSACYLARRLRRSGVEIFLFDQRSSACPYNSGKFFWRLLRKRGLYCCVDNMLLYLADIQRRCVGRGLRYIRARLADPQARQDYSMARQRLESRGLPPVLRSDCDVIEEPWLNYIPVANINSRSDQAKVEAVGPDLVLLAGAPYVTVRTTNLARIAALNPHCGLSPDFAGNSPSIWANYERRFNDIGFTIHVVNATLDGGPIIDQERVEWEKTARISSLWPILAQRMYDRLIDITNGLIAGKEYKALAQRNTTVRPPAGLITKTIAEYRRQRFALSSKQGSKQPPGSSLSASVEERRTNASNVV